MKKQYATILLALVFALGVAVQAQSLHAGFVDVPFEFQAAGKTLPAGTYRIGPISENGLGGLVLSNYENRSSVYVLPNQFQGSLGTKVKVAFEQIGDQHVLSSIEAPSGVYFFPLPTPAAVFAKAKHVDGTTASAAR